MKRCIAQIGTFDVENYGDLLFPIILKQKMKDFDIDLFSPKGGEKPFEKNIHVYKITDLEKMCQEKKYAAIIIGGGDLIRMDNNIAKDYTKELSVSILLWQYPVSVGKRNGIPIIWNALGVPFYFEEWQKEMVHFVLTSVDYISVRDNASKKILEDCQVENVKVVPDTVLCLDEIIDKKEFSKRIEQQKKDKNFNEKDEYIVFQHNKANINNNFYIEKVKELIELASKQYKILFLPIGYVHDDIDFMKKIYDPSNQNEILIEKKLSPMDMMAILANCKAYIGTSMHGAVTAYSFEKSVMVLNPNHLTKMGGLLEELDLSEANITSIKNAISYFKNNLFHQSFDKKKEILKQINDHFMDIKKIIEKSRKEPDFEYENHYMSLCLKNINNCKKEPTCNNILVYYDNGNGYSEQNKKMFSNLAKENKILLQIELDEELKSIRIDPIEGYGLKCRNIMIQANKQTLPFTSPNMIKIEEEYYFLTEDPQIIISSLHNVDEVSISFEYEILKPREVYELFASAYNQVEKLKLENNSYKTQLEQIQNSKSYKYCEKIRKILKNNSKD